MTTRRQIFKEAFKGAAVIAAGKAFGGCSSFIFQVVEEGQISIKISDRSPEIEQALVPGQTRLEKAADIMEQNGVKELRGALHYNSQGKMQIVMGGDYQGKAFVFEDMRYAQSIPLSYDAAHGLPYATKFIMGESEKTDTIAVFSKDIYDKLKNDGIRRQPRIDVFRSANGKFVRTDTFFLGKIEDERNGIVDPVFMGNYLDLGIIMTARDRYGVVWDGGYLLTIAGNDISYKRIDKFECLRCEGLDKYYYKGKAPGLMLGNLVLER